MQIFKPFSPEPLCMDRFQTSGNHHRRLLMIAWVVDAHVQRVSKKISNLQEAAQDSS